MTSDQRRAPRFETDLPVQLSGSDGDALGNLRNLSVSGAAIEFDPTLGKPKILFEIGDSVGLRVDPQADAGPETHGIVVRRDADGIAVKFNQVEDEMMAGILPTIRRAAKRDVT